MRWYSWWRKRWGLIGDAKALPVLGADIWERVHFSKRNLSIEVDEAFLVPTLTASVGGFEANRETCGYHHPIGGGFDPLRWVGGR